MWWSWMDRFWTISNLGGCGDLERTDVQKFPFWEDMVVLKGMVRVVFHWEAVMSWKAWFWIIYPFRGCGSPESTDFGSFYIGRARLSWKDWVLLVFTLGGYGCLEWTGFFIISWLGFAKSQAIKLQIVVHIYVCLWTVRHANIFGWIGQWLTQLMQWAASSFSVLASLPSVYSTVHDKVDASKFTCCIYISNLPSLMYNE